MPRPGKIACVTDRGFLRPTLVSVWSLLRHLTGPAELHVWGTGLSDRDWADVEAVVAGHPGVALHRKDIGTGYLEGAQGPADYISAATMGRLFIPSLIDGYVLYLDGDTLVTGDVGSLFDIDLGMACAGVVRDYNISHWLAHSDAAPPERDRRLSEIRDLLAPASTGDYLNAGVLLLNCDALRAQPQLLTRMTDVTAASACTHGDQDHLNALFSGNVVQLNLAWNASWGRVGKHRALLARCGLPTWGLAPGRPVIVHYHGPQKPWRNKRWDLWSSRGRATLAYRRALRRFRRAHPRLSRARCSHH